MTRASLPNDSWRLTIGLPTLACVGSVQILSCIGEATRTTALCSLRGLCYIRDLRALGPRYSPPVAVLRED